MPGLSRLLDRLPLARRISRRLIGPKAWTKRTGSFREREAYGLISRPNYAYGLLRAADTARFFGKKAVTVCEFGVATGRALSNMATLAATIESETGVSLRIVGFATGKGLPAPRGYKDHPELWSGGDFAMGDPEELKRQLGGKVELVLGDIADTIDRFTASLTPTCPLGFVSIDVDIYTGTVAALRGLAGAADLYLPAMSFYFDDVGSYFSNEYCGELCAIAEHNLAHPMRAICVDRSLPGRRPESFMPWHRSMYVCHVLDHPHRNAPRARDAMSLEDHWQFMEGLR